MVLELVFANSEHRSQHQNNQHSQRDVAVFVVLFLEEEEAGNDHAHDWCGQHQQHAGAFDLERDGSFHDEAGDQAGQHDEEAAEGADA